MQILNAAQIRSWDQFTIERKPISSIDLMETAAMAFCQQFQLWYPRADQNILIFCGPGNNGGDGLAVARILHFAGYTVEVVICTIGDQTSLDFKKNLARLPQQDTIQVYHLNPQDDLQILPPLGLVIDAIFGSGLNRPIQGYWAGLIAWINERSKTIVSIDIPSGLPSDSIQDGPTIMAKQTIGFQVPKLAYFLPENGEFVGQWTLVDIGLHPAYVEQELSAYRYSSLEMVKELLQIRKTFDHKGTHGHGLLIAGSYGMMGAAQLAAKAGLRSGLGLLSLQVPNLGYDILQISVPEAMVLADPNPKAISQIPPLDIYQGIGIGPGLGQAIETQKALWQLLEKTTKPLVIDADALNILAKNKEQLKTLPKNSILTPHPGEFRRLFGKSPDSKSEIQRLQQMAVELEVVIILKGAFTRIASPEGIVYFNATGNPGMATGGSGDILTGILTGLMAQGYPAVHAALLGVWLHGKAGDLAALKQHPIAMNAGDIISEIGAAYSKLEE